MATEEGHIMRNALAITLVILSFVCIALCGCDNFSKFYYSGKDIDLYSAAIYAVPGFGYVMSSTTEVIEKDEYGRTLFLFTARDTNLFPGGYDYVNAAVICQQTNGEEVSYYNDVCYQYLDAEASAAQSDLSTLKSENDWGLPIDAQKCTVRNVVSARAMCKEELSYYYVFGKYKIHKDELSCDIPMKNSSHRNEIYDMDNYGRKILLWSVFPYDGSAPKYYLQYVYMPESTILEQEAVEVSGLEMMGTAVANLRAEHSWGEP